MVGPVKLFEFSAEEATLKTLVKVCGELRNGVSITGTSETDKLADINPVHGHARDIAIQMGIVLHPEGEIVSFMSHTGT